jgi:hypothetical protein
MKIPFTGGCVCGAVRYECSTEPIMMFKCHGRELPSLINGARPKKDDTYSENEARQPQLAA